MSEIVAYKCRMCGANLEVTADSAIVECEYCGSRQSLPKNKGQDVNAQLNRANNLRMHQEFDRAMEVYERILVEDEKEYEAHWGLVLCRYGIEYVEDPKTGGRVPTCHRTLYESVFADINYLAAIEYAGQEQKIIYQAEAEKIAQLQKEILTAVKNERPFDVFLSYKETDDYGGRTRDSVIANDIYYQLTNEGLRVFYAPITLGEHSLGKKYEPVIFAGLTTAKVMIVLGTKIEYFNAAWVKNEWSRYIHFMRQDREKNLIVCHRDIDPADLPDEFAHFPKQDMSKIGFINDLIRGISRICAPEVVPQKEIKIDFEQEDKAAIAPLVRRIFLFLEDGEWESANDYCERVLDMDPEHVWARVAKVMSKYHISRKNELAAAAIELDRESDFQKAMKYATDEERKELQAIYNENLYVLAEKCYQIAIRDNHQGEALKSARLYKGLRGYRDSEEKLQSLMQKAAGICKAVAEQDWEEQKKKLGRKKEEIKKEYDRINEKLRGHRANMSALNKLQGDKKLDYERENSKLRAERSACQSVADAYASDNAKRNGKIALIVFGGIALIGLGVWFVTRIFQGNSPLFDFILYGALALGCGKLALYMFSAATTVEYVESESSRRSRVRSCDNKLAELDKKYHSEDSGLKTKIEACNKDISDYEARLTEREQELKEIEKQLSVNDTEIVNEITKRLLNAFN